MTRARGSCSERWAISMSEQQLNGISKTVADRELTKSKENGHSKRGRKNDIYTDMRWLITLWAIAYR